MDQKTKERIAESYNHIKPYLDEQEELKEMCRRCEEWCWKEHDYAKCKNKPCFKFYLAFEYLEWLASWE